MDIGAPPQRVTLGDRDDGGCHGKRRQPRQPHPGQKPGPAEVQVAEHDEVGQVRSGQQQRSSVGQQQASVQQRGLSGAPAARCIHQDGRQERDRGVQVQRGAYQADQHGCAGEQDAGAGRHPGGLVAGGREQAVPVGDQPDQQQPGNQNERRPVLGSGRTRRSGISDHGGGRCGAASRRKQKAQCPFRANPWRHEKQHAAFTATRLRWLYDHSCLAAGPGEYGRMDA